MSPCSHAIVLWTACLRCPDRTILLNCQNLLPSSISGSRCHPSRSMTMKMVLSTSAPCSPSSH
eukprot:10316129-Ditylum_brightwellii.AAC.1